MLPMYPFEKVLSTCLVISLQIVCLLPESLLGRPLATTKVRRLAIPLLPMSWWPRGALLSLVVHLVKWGHRFNRVICLGTLLKMLLDTQWSLASGQDTIPPLHRSRVTESAPLVEKPSPAPVLPRSAARLHRSGGLRPVLPSLMDPMVSRLVLPICRRVVTVLGRRLYPVADRVAKSTLLSVAVVPSR